MTARISAILLCCWMSGCVVVDLGVTNPIPELTTVAVAPFFNLSHEPSVDGRRCAVAYFSELQKVPGFEVLPVGVAETQIIENELQMNNPDDVLKLAELLDVDAVVVGAITDYDPYYPPRIGWHVRWYSPEQWEFYPGIQTDPDSRGNVRGWDEERLEQWRSQEKVKDDRRAPDSPYWLRAWRLFRTLPGIRKIRREQSMVRGNVAERLHIRAQSAEASSPAGNHVDVNPFASSSPRTRGTAVPILAADDVVTPGEQGVVQPVKAVPNPPLPDLSDLSESTMPSRYLPVPREQSPPPVPPVAGAEDEPVAEPATLPDGSADVELLPPPSQSVAAAQWQEPGDVSGICLENPKPQPNPYNRPKPPELWQLDPRKPLMSYTRMFDGSDANLVAALRDYVELSGDLRSGGWQGYLYRSEDFIRFTAHLMIAEMLTVHGGEARRRIVFKHRNLR